MRKGTFKQMKMKVSERIARKEAYVWPMVKNQRKNLIKELTTMIQASSTKLLLGIIWEIRKRNLLLVLIDLTLKSRNLMEVV